MSFTILLVVGLIAGEPKAVAETTPTIEACQSLGKEVLTTLHEQGYKDVKFTCLPGPELGTPV